jgi:hypothetical protein
MTTDTNVSLTASNFELAAAIDDLRAALPKAPVTELRRDEFERQTAAERMQFIRSGGRVVGEAPPRPKAAPKAGSVSRAEFDTWAADRRHGHIKAGHAVHDV